MRTITTTVYKFDELTPEAHEIAKKLVLCKDGMIRVKSLQEES